MIRILLVEDEMLLRELMFEELSESGYAVTPIATAIEVSRPANATPARPIAPVITPTPRAVCNR